jgi:hypothetical protein
MQWNATGSVQTNASRPNQRCTRFTCGRGIRTIRSSFPKMRAPVETCTTAKTTAGDAYYVPPGHTPIHFAGTEIVEFSPTDALGETIGVVLENLHAAGVEA